MDFNSTIHKVKVGATPFHRFIRAALKIVFRPVGPPLPNLLRPLLRLIYEIHMMTMLSVRWLLVVLYRHPLFQARCTSIGRNVTLDHLPYVSGHAEIHIGNDVRLTGFSVYSGRMIDRPKLIIKDRAEVAGSVVVNKEVVIEEDVRIAINCRISDSDGHPKQADLRAQNAPPDVKEIRPVRICRDVWIGTGCYIMKGVTIGEGAIIGVNSVVTTDIPAYSLAMGNPAEVYFRNYGRPAAPPASAAAASQS